MKRLLIVIIIIFTAASCQYLVPERIEVDKGTIDFVGEYFSTYHISGKYMISVNYLTKTINTKYGKKKIGREYLTYWKDNITDFKRGDTVVIYRKPFSNRQFIINPINGNELYFTEDIIVKTTFKELLHE